MLMDLDHSLGQHAYMLCEHKASHYFSFMNIIILMCITVHSKTWGVTIWLELAMHIQGMQPLCTDLPSSEMGQ